ncbi:hypothetical protein FC52_GL001281 [Lactobacillus pasteurii DSM 23907 = CRBIP 24.76]|nr:hypothetical protein FC52_GL001281 [Lactobacillus pasteurii DSM 23907 = CRBIP 24.76]
MEVDDPAKLTDDEKGEVIKAVEDANKDDNGNSTLPDGTKITVGDNGDVTVTYPDKSVDTIPGNKLVEEKSSAEKLDPTVPDNPDTTNDAEDIVIPKDQDKDNGSKDNGNKDADSSDTTKQVEHLTNKANGKQEVQKLSASPVSENQANAQLPQTGEKNNLATALIAAGLGLIALAGRLFSRKKN